VIEPRINLRSNSTATPQPGIENNWAIVSAESAVQTRAYELYEFRGRIDGCAEQDWYQAETDLRARSKEASWTQTCAGPLPNLELFYGLRAVGPTGIGLYPGNRREPGHRFVGVDRF
jgi:hypothetical protein